jgi:hypothetical protein
VQPRVFRTAASWGRFHRAKCAGETLCALAEQRVRAVVASSAVATPAPESWGSSVLSDRRACRVYSGGVAPPSLLTWSSACSNSPYFTAFVSPLATLRFSGSLSPKRRVGGAHDAYGDEIQVSNLRPLVQARLAGSRPDRASRADEDLRGDRLFAAADPAPTDTLRSLCLRAFPSRPDISTIPARTVRVYLSADPWRSG